MKFSSQNCIKKECFGMKIFEYCCVDNRLPLDCAVVKFRNNKYPWKINHGFHEAFFILEGECFIEFENETVQLSKHDFFIIEPEKKAYYLCRVCRYCRLLHVSFRCEKCHLLRIRSLQGIIFQIIFASLKVVPESQVFCPRSCPIFRG